MYEGCFCYTSIFTSYGTTNTKLNTCLCLGALDDCRKQYLGRNVFAQYDKETTKTCTTLQT